MARKTKSELERAAQTAAAHAASSIFETAEEFREAADKYFADCDAAGKLYDEAGLCLGLTRYNRKGRKVLLQSLRRWCDGEVCPYLQEEVQYAYLRIQEQIATSPAYQEKGMVTRGIFLQKQKQFGGYQDRVETKQDTTVHIVHGADMDKSDFG